MRQIIIIIMPWYSRGNDREQSDQRGWLIRFTRYSWKKSTLLTNMLISIHLNLSNHLAFHKLRSHSYPYTDWWPPLSFNWYLSVKCIPRVLGRDFKCNNYFVQYANPYYKLACLGTSHWMHKMQSNAKQDVFEIFPSNLNQAFQKWMTVLKV